MQETIKFFSLGRMLKMNNTEREQWVLNDQTLYNQFKASRLSMTKFIRVNRAEIDAQAIKIIGYDPCKRSNNKPNAKTWMF